MELGNRSTTNQHHNCHQHQQHSTVLNSTSSTPTSTTSLDSTYNNNNSIDGNCTTGQTIRHHQQALKHEQVNSFLDDTSVNTNFAKYKGKFMFRIL